MASSESYASLFTGDELDLAIAKAMGNKYRGITTPGCHLIGDTTDTVVDLDRLLIPGKYTIYFYENGPASFIYKNGTNMSEDTVDSEDLSNSALFSIRPIYLVMYTTGGDHLYQTIMVGARLYWRDMWSNENIVGTHIPWRCSDLGVEASIITDHVEYTQTGSSESLSQRMGTALMDKIKRLEIGNANLLNFTNGYFMYGRVNPSTLDVTNDMSKYWNMQNGKISTVTYDDIKNNNVSFPTGSAVNINLFPLFDDIDSDIVSLFISDNSSGSGLESVFMSYSSSSSGIEYNKIYMSGNAKYTASVYLVYDEAFYTMQNDNKAFITISLNDNVIKTKEIVLNRLSTSMDESITNPGVPYCINDILVGTEYDSGGHYPDNPDFKVINKAASETGYYRLTVTIDPTDLDDANMTDIKLSFGFLGSEAKGIFVLPKVECGEYATQYNHSWGDLYYYFTNSEAFFGVPINILHPSQFENQDSFVYNESNNMFEAEPVAIGGGGGFVVHERDDLTVETMNDNNRRYAIANRNNPEKIPVSYKPDGKNLINGHDPAKVDSKGYALGGYQELYTATHLAHYYPRYEHILFLNKQTNELLYWDKLCNKNHQDGSADPDQSDPYGTTGGFVSLNKPFVLRKGVDGHSGPQPVNYSNDQSYTESFAGTNQFWLDKPSATGGTTSSKAATLKYYDPEEEMWLTAKADAASIYVVQPTAPGPEFLGKFWINNTTNALYYSVVETVNNEPQVVWKPIFSIWGANPTTNPTTNP